MRRKKNPDDDLPPEAGLGPYARESIPARGPERDFTAEERAAINAIGKRHGCHMCGTKDPGTVSGDFIPDHQRPNSMRIPGVLQRLFPHCLDCSRNHGLALANRARRLKKNRP